MVIWHLGDAGRVASVMARMNKRLLMEREILRDGLRQASTGKFAFIRSHQEEFPVEVVCRVLGVSRSGLLRVAGACAERGGASPRVTQRIRQVHRESREVLAAPRIHRQLRSQGVRCSKNTVAKLMHRAAIRSKARRWFVVRTTDSRHASDRSQPAESPVPARAEPGVGSRYLVHRDRRRGWLYLAVVIDLYSRRVVGGLPATLWRRS